MNRNIFLHETKDNDLGTLALVGTMLSLLMFLGVTPAGMQLWLLAVPVVEMILAVSHDAAMLVSLLAIWLVGTVLLYLAARTVWRVCRV